MKNVLKYLLTWIIFVAAALFTAIITSVIASSLTQDINSIITSTLISVWIVIIVLNIIRSRILYQKKMKEIDVQDRDTYNSKVKKLKIQYIVPLVIFSILFGFTMYFSKNTILNSIAGGNQGAELRGDVLGNTIRSPMVALRIGTLILVLAVIVIRIVVQKRKTNGS